MAMLDALVLSKLLLSEETSSAEIAAYEAEMFARMHEMTADTMVNTEMFYASDAADVWSPCFEASVEQKRSHPLRRLDRSLRLRNLGRGPPCVRS